VGPEEAVVHALLAARSRYERTLAAVAYAKLSGSLSPARLVAAARGTPALPLVLELGDAVRALVEVLAQSVRGPLRVSQPPLAQPFEQGADRAGVEDVAYLSLLASLSHSTISSTEILERSSPNRLAAAAASSSFLLLTSSPRALRATSLMLIPYLLASSLSLLGILTLTLTLIPCCGRRSTI